MEADYENERRIDSVNCKRLLGLIFCLVVVFGYYPLSANAAGIPLEVADIGTLTLPGNLDIKPAIETETAPGLSAQYDLTCLDTDTWHYARLVIFKDNRDMGLAAAMFNQGVQNPQILNALSDSAKNMLEKSLSQNGAHMLEWYPPRSAVAGKRNALSVAFRCTATDKLPMPLYASMYFFVPDQKLAGVAIFCADSDRKYWEPLLKDAVQKLN